MFIVSFCVVFGFFVTKCDANCGDNGLLPSLNQNDLHKVHSILTCLSVNFEQQFNSNNFWSFRNSPLQEFGVLPFDSLHNCTEARNITACNVIIQSYSTSRNRDSLTKQIATNIVNAAMNENDIPNSCHCLSSYDPKEMCVPVFEEFALYCRTFFPINYASGNAVFQCSAAIMSICNITQRSFENIIDCAKVILNTQL